MRCPNGTRKNKKGECVKYTGAKNANTNKSRNAKTNIILENVNKSKLKKVLELCSKENIKYTFDNSSKMSPTNNLIPGQKYLLTSENDPDNIVVLECEFIKYYNNQYLEDFMQYDRKLEMEGNPQIPAGLVGTVFNKKGNVIRPVVNFDNELYPYYRFRQISQYRSPHIGLFRFIRIVSIRYKGIPVDIPSPKFVGRNMFYPFNTKSYINTVSLIENVTLMWVYLEKENLFIRPKLEADNIIQEKLPEYIESNPSPKVNYRKILKDKIKIMITNDLTIGRSDEDLEPFTSDQINTFIKENDDKIEQVITTIITEYTNDNELETLQNAKYSWIGEYLYEVVDTMGSEAIE